MGPLARFSWALALLAACSDDPPFESLATLCAGLAEDLCDVRGGGCCPGVDPAACLMPEQLRCQAELDLLSREALLKYDARDAADKRRAARRQLDNCGAPVALATYFTGGLVDGTPCERDTQCSGGRCTPDTRVCAPATPVLCAP